MNKSDELKKLQELFDSGYGLFQHCPFCGCPFTPCGNFKYCSSQCARLAQMSQIKHHKLKRLGTTELGSHRNKNFVREWEIISKEKKKLRII